MWVATGRKRPSFARSFVFDAGKPDCRLQDIPDVGELPSGRWGPRVSNDDAAIPEHRPRFGDLRLPIGAPTRNAKTPGLKLVDLRPPFGIAWFRLFYCLFG